MTAPTDDPDRPGTFLVSIVYVEAEYARTRGIDVVPYSASYTVAATSPEGAINVAINRFHAAARESSVSWPRDITETTCQRLK
jgi:hypothetical protein